MILSSCHLWWSPEKQLSTWALASLWRLVLSLDTWWVYENSLQGACRYSSDQERDCICNENPEQPRGETGLNSKVHTNTSFLYSTSFAESRMMRYMRPYKMNGALFPFCIHCGGPACNICNSGVSRIFTDFLKQVTRSPPAENLLTHYLHHPCGGTCPSSWWNSCCRKLSNQQGNSWLQLADHTMEFEVVKISVTEFKVIQGSKPH